MSTTGANGNGYSIISPQTYTSGIFEARIYFPASQGQIADWPAFWLSSAWASSAPGYVPFPSGGEADLAEGMGGQLDVTYHYGASNSQLGSYGITRTPGWHIITGVWKKGEWDVYYDGVLVRTLNSGVVVNDPMNVILNAYQGNLGLQPGVPSTMEVSYLRIWSLAGA